jgi:hypothetical protein
MIRESCASDFKDDKEHDLMGEPGFLKIAKDQ